MEVAMYRHPRYPELPWEGHWQRDGTTHHHWWLMSLVILAALLVIGVGVTGGIF
jgi:hypothetical protein